jgi:hypothetical protein
MSNRLLRSVGIDLGTTTSQVIFSELEIVNTAGPTSVPHYEFSRRDILYVSPVIFTPFADDGQVDVRALDVFIRQQYELAGLTVSQSGVGRHHHHRRNLQGAQCPRHGDVAGRRAWVILWSLPQGRIWNR